MDTALDGIGEPVLPIDRHVLAEASQLLADSAGLELVGVSLELERLGRNHVVYRARANGSDKARSVVVKRLDPDAARRNRLVAQHWLPRIRLESVAPELLGAVAALDSEAVWHIYEDVSGIALKERQSDRESVSAAVELIADLHTRAAGQPIISECRREGGNLGMEYFTANVSDAVNLLDALRPPRVRTSRQEAQLRDRLRRRLDDLLADAPRRARLMAEAGGPETMLHGDLWTINVLINDSENRVRVRLVDWDNAGAGPICYDFSTFLYRFERGARPWIFAYYGKVVARAGWHLPPVPEFNVLCDTAECARYASRIVWPAKALLEDGAAWGFVELAAIEHWFEVLEPVLDA